MTAPPRPYLVAAVDLDGDGDAITRRFADRERAAAWADRMSFRYSSVELLVPRQAGPFIAVRDRAALAAATDGGC